MRSVYSTVSISPTHADIPSRETEPNKAEKRALRTRNWQSRLLHRFLQITDEVRRFRVKRLELNVTFAYYASFEDNLIKLVIAFIRQEKKNCKYYMQLTYVAW